MLYSLDTDSVITGEAEVAQSSPIFLPNLKEIRMKHELFAEGNLNSNSNVAFNISHTKLFFIPCSLFIKYRSFCCSSASVAEVGVWGDKN